MILAVTVLLILGVAAVSFAEVKATQSEQIPVPERSDQEFYENMWEFCHGENGMMNQYFDEEDGLRGTQNKI